MQAQFQHSSFDSLTKTGACIRITPSGPFYLAHTHIKIKLEVQQTARFLHQQKQDRILLKLDIQRPLILCRGLSSWWYCSSSVSGNYGEISLVGCSPRLQPKFF
jgi:hypothetical protein